MMTTIRQAKLDYQHPTPWRRANFACALALTLGLSAALPQPAQAKVSDAEAALIGAMVSQAIGGKTTLGDNAGEIEGWMVSASLLQSAAETIKTKVGSGGGLILVGNEAPNLGLPGSIHQQASKFTLQLNSVCGKQPKTGIRILGGDNVDTALAAAISGAPKTETEITGYSVALSDEALVDALLGTLGTGWMRLEDAGVAASSATILTEWDAIRQKRYDMAAKCEKSDEGKALIKLFDELDTRITTLADNGGPSILEQAAQIETVLRATTSRQILRIHIEKAGGSVTNTNNFATRLGWPAVHMTGGLVVRYRLVSAATSLVDTGKAGIIVCHSPRKTIGAIHRGKLPAASEANCSVAIPVSDPAKNDQKNKG